MISSRTNRRNFILVFIGGFLTANAFLVLALFVNKIPAPAGNIIGYIMGLAIVLFTINLAITWVLATIKRLHDINVTGWLAVLFLGTPLLIILAFIPGTKGPNQYGIEPSRELRFKSIFFWRN